MVMTDGDAEDKDDVIAASKAWAKNGATVLAIGVGSEDRISDSGLKILAGEKGKVHRVADFNDIHNHANTLLKQVCQALKEGECLH